MLMDLKSLVPKLPLFVAGIVVFALLVTFTSQGKALVQFISNNISAILITLMFLIAVYFYWRGQSAVKWRPAEECFRKAVNNGALAIPRGFTRSADMWATVTGKHQLESFGAWLFTGELHAKGKISSVMIDGTRGDYWVRHTFNNEIFFGQTDVQKLERKRLTLEEKFAEAARSQAEIKGIIEKASESSENV